MSNHSVIEHRANYHFLKIEEDYVLICSQGEQYPQCKAAILAILEHWVNDKKSKGQETRVYMTYPEWIDAMYGLFRRSTIIACLNELISEGLIARSPCRRHGKDTYEYILYVQVVQERLKSLAERVEKNTRPNLNASKFKRVQKQTDVNLDGTTHSNLNGTSSDAFKNKRNVDSITEIPSSIDSKDTRVASPYVDAPLAPVDFLPEETHENDAQVSRPAAAHDPLPGSSSDAHALVGAAPDVEEDIPTAHRLPAIKLNGASNGNSPAYSTPGDAGRLSGVPAAELPDSPTDVTGPAQAVSAQIASASTSGEPDSPPALSRHSFVSLTDGAATGSSSEPRASGKRRGKKVTQEPEPIPEEALRILDDWDSLHKKPVLRSDANIQAAKLLVQAQTNREELKGCRDWLPTTDRPGKPWYRRIGVHLPDIAAKLEQYRSLQEMPLADKRNDVTSAQWEAALKKTGQSLEEEVPAWLDFDNYVGNGPEARQKLVERGRELKAQGFCPDL